MQTSVGFPTVALESERSRATSVNTLIAVSKSSGLPSAIAVASVQTMTTQPRFFEFIPSHNESDSASQLLDVWIVGSSGRDSWTASKKTPRPDRFPVDI